MAVIPRPFPPICLHTAYVAVTCPSYSCKRDSAGFLPIFQALKPSIIEPSNLYLAS